MLRMDEGISNFVIFRKMADVEIRSCLFDQHFTHIFGYIKKNNRPKKKILRPSEGQIYIK